MGDNILRVVPSACLVLGLHPFVGFRLRQKMCMGLPVISVRARISALSPWGESLSLVGFMRFMYCVGLLSCRYVLYVSQFLVMWWVHILR
jgi:hypothetical protein